MLGIFLLFTFTEININAINSNKMKKTFTIILCSLSIYSLKAQSFIQAYQDRADLVTQTNITTNLQDFSNLGIKTTGSSNNTAALDWIKSKYVSYGYSASQIVEDPFTFNSTSSKNLVITKTGTVYPNKYVIICGHFDTLNGPGVNDNGSGTSIILEAARILKDVPTEYSIKFIHFSGEEQGLRGSRHYANTVAYQGTNRILDIKLVFNLDQVGGKMGNNNDTIYCDEDMGGNANNTTAGAAATQELVTLTGLYSPLLADIDEAEDTDYMPFEAKGEVITGYFEKIRSNYPHTSNDTFANTDPVYIYNVGKASVGALQHFAVASTSTLSTKNAPVNTLENIKIYPNPAKDILHIKLPNKVENFSFEITDMLGHTLIKEENKTQINISALSKGVYLGVVKSGDKTTVRKVLIK